MKKIKFACILLGVVLLLLGIGFDWGAGFVLGFLGVFAGSVLNMIIDVKADADAEAECESESESEGE